MVGAGRCDAIPRGCPPHLITIEPEFGVLKFGKNNPLDFSAVLRIIG
jgi:hypothetical protein